MPPLPKHRRSKSKQGMYTNNARLVLSSLSRCPQCHEPRLPHRVCPHCGYYNGREVVKKTAVEGKG